MAEYATCTRCGTTVLLTSQHGNIYRYATCPKCKNKVIKEIRK